MGENSDRTSVFLTELRKLSTAIRNHQGDADAIRAAYEECFEAHSKANVEQSRSTLGINIEANSDYGNGSISRGSPADPWQIYYEFVAPKTP